MNKYFKIAPSNDKDRIEIECGKNGRVFLIRTDMGMVVDVYANGNDDGVVATMSVWDEDMNNERDFTDDLSEDEQPDVCKPPTAEEINEFKAYWGQTHEEICANLEYDEIDSDDLLMMDYFWLQSRKEWYPKMSSVYTEKDQIIADGLRDGRFS